MVTLHDGVPVPKIIDFGVAKAIHQRLTEKTAFTRYGQMVGTPLYMSPEQAEMSGLDVDTRTDIYSLGVLLYELLTGSTPIAAHRKTEPGKLRYLLRGELDWIVMKALEKDRTRRYETAGGFGRDIQRHLNDEAVEACPPSAGYRLRKFVRRNKAAFATAGVVALALVAGTGVATWQAVRAT